VEAVVRAFLDELAAWAGERDDVHALLLLGSQARTDAPADESSDVDVVLFVDAPASYLEQSEWLDRFGRPLLSFVEATAVGGFEERRALFEDGLEVDFSILPAAAAREIPPGAAPVFARGFRILYDDGLGLEPPEHAPAEAAPPSQAELDRLANDFWYHLLWAAKKLRRGELLVAKQACDCWLTGLLVELVRLRAHGLDTWHGYRFFERWAGEDVVEALPRTFAAYDAADLARALRATGELFARLQREVAERFGLEQPVDESEILRRLDALVR
jgi:aminoglycoside 6-adenylyltransferase